MLNELCEEKLSQDLAHVNRLKSIIESSELLTNNITGVLDVFENRLANLEKSVLPIYQESGNLQRRKQNIELALDRLDHVISYHCVSSEVDDIIKNGSITSNTEAYLSALNQLQDALTFFRSSGTQSIELHNVTLMYEQGVKNLNNEFCSIVTKNSSFLLPIAVMNFLDQQNSSTGSLSSVYVFDIPEHVIKDVRVIGNWLAEHQCTSYIDRYAEIRAQALVRTLQELQRYLRSRSIGSTDLKSYSLANCKGHEGTKNRPPTRRIFNNRTFEKTATKFWHKATHSMQNAISMNSPSSVRTTQSDGQDDMGVDDNDVDVYFLCVTALLKLIQNEHAHLVQIVPESYAKRALQVIVKPAVINTYNNGQMLAQRASKCISHMEFNLALPLFTLLYQLINIRSDFERTLRGCEVTIRNKMSTVIDQMHKVCTSLLDEFRDWIQQGTDRHLPLDGTVHQRTCDALMFCQHLTDYTQTVGWLLCQHPDHDIVSAPGIDTNKALLGLYIKRILNGLKLYIITSSEGYSDVCLRSIFRLNNYRYIICTLEQSGILDIVMLSEPGIVRQFNSLINDQKRVYSQSWSRVLQIITTSDDIFLQHIEMNRLTPKEQQLVKDKFSSFNREMEEMCRVQHSYSVVDNEMRESLKRDNKEFILPKYTRFYDRYYNVNFTKNLSKYIKYSPLQVSAMIDGFFDISA